MVNSRILSSHSKRKCTHTSNEVATTTSSTSQKLAMIQQCAASPVVTLTSLAIGSPIYRTDAPHAYISAVPAPMASTAPHAQPHECSQPVPSALVWVTRYTMISFRESARTVLMLVFVSLAPGKACARLASIPITLRTTMCSGLVSVQPEHTARSEMAVIWLGSLTRPVLSAKLVLQTASTVVHRSSAYHAQCQLT